MDKLYARKGEIVTCERGHVIGPLTRDIARGDVFLGEDVEGYEVSLGAFYPPCKECGALWTGFSPTSGGCLHFKDEGFRQ